MRTSLLLLAAAALAAPATMSTPVRAEQPPYRYCMQPSGQWGPECKYANIEQCRASASAVGFCYENPRWTVAAQGRAERIRRP